MIEGQLPRVQHLPRQRPRAPARVNGVAENRVTEMLHVHADLVSTSAMQAAFNETRPGSAANDAKVCAGLAAAFSGYGHFSAVNAMPRDSGIDYSGIPAKLSGDERKIDFFNRARGELSGKVEMRRVIFRGDKTAARLLVEAVDNARAQFSANAGEVCAMSHQRINECAVILSSASVNGDARRFVDHDDIGVLEQN